MRSWLSGAYGAMAAMAGGGTAVAVASRFMAVRESEGGERETASRQEKESGGVGGRLGGNRQ
eukprot:425417-Hanusia_phi.AAC.1